MEFIEYNNINIRVLCTRNKHIFLFKRLRKNIIRRLHYTLYVIQLRLIQKHDFLKKILLLSPNRRNSFR